MDAPSMDFGGLLPVVALHLFRGHERGRILSGQSVAPRSRLGVHAGDMPRAESATSAVSGQPCRPASRRSPAYRPGKPFARAVHAVRVCRVGRESFVWGTIVYGIVAF